MLDDVKLAMLGDKAAAQILTKQGVSIPCQKTRPFKFSNEMEDWEYHG